MAYLTQMVLRGAAPQRGAKKHAALRGGPEMPRLLCCRISQTHYSESARSSAAHTGHFRPIAIPAITRTGSRSAKHDHIITIVSPFAATAVRRQPNQVDQRVCRTASLRILISCCERAPGKYFIYNGIEPRIADCAAYADKHRASMLRDLHTHCAQRCLITVMAIRLLFLRRHYRNDPAPLPYWGLRVESRPQEEVFRCGDNCSYVPSLICSTAHLLEIPLL